MKLKIFGFVLGSLLLVSAANAQTISVSGSITGGSATKGKAARGVVV